MTVLKYNNKVLRFKYKPKMTINKINDIYRTSIGITDLDEITLTYLNNSKMINIFGNEFIQNNEDKCKMNIIYNEKICKFNKNLFFFWCN